MYLDYVQILFRASNLQVESMHELKSVLTFVFYNA